MSHAAPCGRAMPRWSVAVQPLPGVDRRARRRRARACRSGRRCSPARRSCAATPWMLPGPVSAQLPSGDEVVVRGRALPQCLRARTAGVVGDDRVREGRGQDARDDTRRRPAMPSLLATVTFDRVERVAARVDPAAPPVVPGPVSRRRVAADRRVGQLRRPSRPRCRCRRRPHVADLRGVPATRSSRSESGPPPFRDVDAAAARRRVADDVAVGDVEGRRPRRCRRRLPGAIEPPRIVTPLIDEGTTPELSADNTRSLLLPSMIVERAPAPLIVSPASDSSPWRRTYVPAGTLIESVLPARNDRVAKRAGSCARRIRLAGRGRRSC